MGPNYANFRAITVDLLTHSAIHIAGKEELATALIELLRDTSAASAMGERQERSSTSRPEQQSGAWPQSWSCSPRRAGPNETALAGFIHAALCSRIGPPQFEARRGWEPVRRLRFPVVSIGNLSTGGAEKRRWPLRSPGLSRSVACLPMCSREATAA